MKRPVFCTLFDSNYLDKGLVLNDSLQAVCENYTLYVLAMDDLCLNVLDSMKSRTLIPITLNDFLEQEDLSDIYRDRPRVEFLWTCSCHLIDYVISFLQEEWCTYIDADLFFYSDPSVLLAEMGDRTVQIIEHRFSDSHDDKLLLAHSGRYCVEFNTFKKEERSLKLLDWWKQQCRESCSSVASDKVFGDQKYLTDWEKYDFVSVVKNLGGGIAPWNVGQYKLINDRTFEMEQRKTKERFNPVFYHFHNIAYYDAKTVNINVFKRYWRADDELVYKFYLPYLRAVDAKKDFLKENYAFYPLIVVHPAFVQAAKESEASPKNHAGWPKKLFHTDVYREYAYVVLKGFRQKVFGRKDTIHL